VPGDTMRLTVFRNDRLRDFTVKLEKPRVTPYRVRQIEHMVPEQKAILDSWLPDGGS
jgi:predicted metalloprotease with PDZ domain